jgi:UDP-2-acetamido-3-amino-2,3-dideoxy-glucuronate N-acetyltransferase
VIHPSADVDERAEIGAGAVVWHLAQVREDARVGAGCVVGRGAYVDAGVQVGDNVKIGNYALLYAPARVGDGAFIGPAAVLANDLNPRSVNPDGGLKGSEDWEIAGVFVGEGASVGANATVLPGVRVGRWAMVGAGAVVTRDVPPFALVAGVPARLRGWVGRAGVPLDPDGDGAWRCPRDGSRYIQAEDGLVEA